MEISKKTRKMALGTRLRLLTAKVSEDMARMYALYGFPDFSPKWAPVLFFLFESEGKSIPEIAAGVGYSRSSVSKLIKEIANAGLAKGKQTPGGRRRNLLDLTDKGKTLTEKMIKVQCTDMEIVMENILAETSHNLWEAMTEWELLLAQKSLFKRVQEQRKIRESKDVRIVAYEPKYQTAFKSLNEEWISRYFEIEETDRKALDHPKEYILDKGGKILVALYRGEPLGVCALIKMNDPAYDFEMAKMAVSPEARGKNIGWMLGQAILKVAKEAGASKIYLESNTALKPAISLYYKMGFQEITGRPTPYKRADIQMELLLSKSE